jgi:hypothetical protein
MNPQRKAKKPARIKGEVYTNSYQKLSWLHDLPLHDIDALVEQVARAIYTEAPSCHQCGSWVTHVPEVKDRYRKQARAALRSIGVPIKGGMKP